MKVVILAGGFGTRISEESQFKPKPMVELGGMPIIWHIMKLYSSYGFNEFIICAGYKQHVIKEYVGNEPFMLTYGDGVSDVNIAELVEFHKKHGKLVTMSAYNPGQRFGVLDIDESGRINEFREKTSGDGSLINIGYMVCQPEFIDYIDGDETVLEKKPLETVAKLGELMAYKHTGFWQCMDTVREKEQLEKMWNNNNAPWKIWK